MSSPDSSNSNPGKIKGNQKKCKVQRQAEIELWHASTSALIAEIEKLDDELNSKRDKLKQLDQLFLSQDEIILDNEGDDELDDLAAQTPISKDAYIADLKAQVNAGDVLAIRQDERIDSFRAQLANNSQLIHMIYAAASAAISKNEREHTVALTKQRLEMEPMYTIGRNVRNRALEQALNPRNPDDEIIAKGNKGAHEGDVLADIQLYSGENPMREDISRFEDYYGASLQFVNANKGLSKFIDALNWNFNIETIMARKDFPTSNLAIPRFRKEFKGVIEQMNQPKSTEEAELEKKTKESLLLSSMKRIHDTALVSYKAWLKLRNQKLK